MKLFLAITYISFFASIFAYRIPYDPVNEAYKAATGKELSRNVNGLWSGPAQTAQDNSERSVDWFVRAAKRKCGVEDSYSLYDIQDAWKPNWAETMSSVSTITAQLRPMNATTGLPGDVFLTLEGIYNASFLCSINQGCIGLIDRTLAPPGTPVELIPVERTVVIFKRVALGAPTELCVINSDVITGVDPGRILTRVVMHPDVLANMDASTSTVGGQADSGMGFNYYQQFGNKLRIHSILFLMEPTLVGFADAITIQADIIISGMVQ